MRILRGKTMMQTKKKYNPSVVDTNLVHPEKVIIFCITLDHFLCYFYSVCYWLLFMQNKKPNTQTSRQTQKPNSNKPKTWNRKSEIIVCLFSGLAQSCATLNLVFFSSDTVDSVSNQDGCHYGTHEIYCWHFQPYIFGSTFILLW